MSALGDVIIDALQELLHILFSPIENLIQNHGNDLVRTVIGTPHPDSVFSAPSNQAWPDLYAYHWDSIVPLALLLWALAIGLVIFLESTSHLFSSYHRTKLKKRAFTGLLGILSWWWIAALSLRFMDALVAFIVPDLSTVTFFDTASFSAMGVLGVVIALVVDFSLFVLIAVIYFARNVVLYMFVLMMPILIACWIPGVGPLSHVSAFAKRMGGFFVPFLFMTLPVAILFRLGMIIGSNANLSMGGFGAWLTGLIIPIVAVVSPFVLFWQAGAIFFLAERASHHVSARNATRRTARLRQGGRATRQGSRNFLRGAQGKPAIRDDGQMLLGSGNSRAHAVGSRLSGGGASLRERFSRGGDGGGSVGSPAPPLDGGQSRPDLSQGKSTPELDTGRSRPQLPADQSTPELRTGRSQPQLEPPSTGSRATNFDSLRSRTAGTRRDT